MSHPQSSEASRQRFNALVSTGTYAADFSHPTLAQDFVAGVVGGVLDTIAPTTLSPKILDAGCGNGAWLHFLYHCAESRGMQPEMYGFDVADRMVETAQDRLSVLDSQPRLRRGDILDPYAYRFEEGPAVFDLVFAYDVVQQVERARQFEALKLIAGAVKPGGHAVVFDHERWSKYGIRMAFRKFVTARLGIPLVPRYFTAASYPALRKAARDLPKAMKVDAEVVTTGHPKKRALVLRRSPEAS